MADSLAVDLDSYAFRLASTLPRDYYRSIPVLVAHIKAVIAANERFHGRTCDKFYIGKSFVRQWRGRTFDPSRPTTHMRVGDEDGGVRGRWSARRDKGYHNLAVVTVVTNNDLPPLRSRNPVHWKQQYTLALEQALITHFMFVEDDQRLENETTNPGGLEGGRAMGYVLYVAIKFTDTQCRVPNPHCETTTPVVKSEKGMYVHAGIKEEYPDQHCDQLCTPMPKHTASVYAAWPSQRPPRTVTTTTPPYSAHTTSNQTSTYYRASQTGVGTTLHDDCKTSPATAGTSQWTSGNYKTNDVPYHDTYDRSLGDTPVTQTDIRPSAPHTPAKSSLAIPPAKHITCSSSAGNAFRYPDATTGLRIPETRTSREVPPTSTPLSSSHPDTSLESLIPKTTPTREVTPAKYTSSSDEATMRYPNPGIGGIPAAPTSALVLPPKYTRSPARDVTRVPDPSSGSCITATPTSQAVHNVLPASLPARTTFQYPNSRIGTSNPETVTTPSVTPPRYTLRHETPPPAEPSKSGVCRSLFPPSLVPVDDFPRPSTSQPETVPSTHIYPVPAPRSGVIKPCKCGSTTHQRISHHLCPLRKPCRCGSTAHQRVNHSSCPLNPRNQLLPADNLHPELWTS